jgi:hypothetical protein
MALVSLCVQIQPYILVTINTELPIRKTCNPRKMVTAKEGGGTGWRSSLRHCTTSRVRFPMVPLEYFSDSLLRTVVFSNGTEHQGYFLAVEAAGGLG